MRSLNPFKARMFAPMDIPNQDGFQFIGVDAEGKEFGCTVKKNAIGHHSAYRDADGDPCFMQLIGWKNVPSA